jgi:small subunit ribosomal protein S20
MANTSSAKKAARQMKKRTAINTVRSSKLKGVLKKVEEALAAGKAEEAKKALAVAEPALMQAAAKNVVHKKAASRKVSRLTHRLKKLAAA